MDLRHAVLQPPVMLAAARSAFSQIRLEFLSDLFSGQPTLATCLGIHDYDDRLEDYSVEGVQDAVRSARRFRTRLLTIPQGALSFADEIDRQQMLLAVEAEEIRAECVRRWATSPDLYSSGLACAAYSMVKRQFAPAEERGVHLLARLHQMPAALIEARRNLVNPPQVFTEVALEQIDGNRAFFQVAVPQAFEGAPPALQRELVDAAGRVAGALGEYKTWLEEDVLPRSNGDFRVGPDTYRRRLWAEEMIDTPLDELLAMAEEDFERNRAAFVETARRIDPHKPAREVLADVERQRPRADELFQATEQALGAAAAFVRERNLVDIPSDAPVHVKETPPFLRATTSASIEIPGPFEAVSTEAYYNLTLPDPRLDDGRQSEFMRHWYYAAISNVSVHEVWPGHHLQFLHARSHSSDVTRVLGVATSVEGWAHYAEQMMIDEGFGARDPRYQLAQLQDALLRNARLISGIRMHTLGMPMADVVRLFEEQAFQPNCVAKLEARRGTFDATYGAYTLGKLLLLRLRDEYRHALGTRYSLRGFHNAFMRAGPLPLPLARIVMLRQAGLKERPRTNSAP